MGHPRQDQKQAQLGHRCVAQCRANPEGLGDLVQDKEQTEDGAQGHCGGGGGLIEIAAQSAAESLDARGVPMGETGEGAIFHFTFIAEGFAEEDGGWGIAVGDGGDVHTYLLSHTRALSRIKLPLHDYYNRPKSILTTEAIATYLNLGEGRSVRRATIPSCTMRTTRLAGFKGGVIIIPYAFCWYSLKPSTNCWNDVGLYRSKLSWST